MSNDKRLQFEGATVLNQAFLDACQDNLCNQLELIVDIEKPGGGYIHASDRNKYVVEAGGAGTFYEALLTFPIISRTVGDFLNPGLEFSQLELSLSNVDGRFNDMLPAGSDYSGWVGKSVTVKLGLGEIESTFKTIFQGEITEQGGFKRGVSKVTFIARDKFNKINRAFPNEVLTTTAFPNLESDKQNVVVPVIYGDWTVNVEPGMASVPAIPVNGADPTVNGDTSHATNLQLVVAAHGLQSFDTTAVYLQRGERVWLIPSADITSVSIAGPGVSSFAIVQNSGLMTAQTPETDDAVLEYDGGDTFFVKVKGKSLGAYSDNLVAQAKDMLLTWGGLISGDFDANWDTIRDKASPAESAIASFKSRVWIQEPENLLEYVLSLLEQVRVEAYIDKNLKLKLLPLHFDAFVAAPTHTIRNWDIEQGSFSLMIDERTNFNRIKGVYNFLPNRKENLQETKIYKNDAAITQAGRPISKKIVFPNLYEEATVIHQVKETLKVTSAYFEYVNLTTTWRSMLLDIGDFVKLNVQIQSTVFNDVPALVREVGYDPAGIKVPLRLWSFQMLPFSGYTPGYAGTVGGSTATITEET
jgi:hypothetical protein